MNDNKIKVLDKYPGPFGTSTNPGVVNQLKEFESKVRQGYTGVEVGTLHSKVFASIPKQIWEEIARSAYINDIKLTVHAPVQDLQITGFDPETGIHNEQYRKTISNSKLFAVIQAAGEMANIYGRNILVNVHAGEVYSAQWDKQWEEKVKSYLRQNPQAFNEVKNKLVTLGYLDPNKAKQINSPDQLPSWVFAKAISVYYPDSYFNVAELRSIRASEYYDPATGHVNIKTVVDNLYEQNWREWHKILGSIHSAAAELKNILVGITPEAGKALYDPSKVGLFYNAYSILKAKYSKIEENLYDLYTRLKNFGHLNEQELKQIRQRLNKLKEIRDKLQEIEAHINTLQNIAISRPVEEYKQYAQYIFKKMLDYSYYNLQQIEELSNELGKITMQKGVPRIYLPVPEHAPELAAKTIKETYERYFRYIKEKHPDWINDPEKLDVIIPSLVIEESYPGFVGTRPDEWIKFIENARKALKDIIEKDPQLKTQIKRKYGSIEKFVEEKVGANLDIGHIKMYTKYGYTKEDIINWLRQIKPYIKHLHITEAQHGEDTHLLPGMSWEDITKAELEELRDLLAEKGVYMVYEPGGWYAGQLFHDYGGELPYILEYNGFNPYSNLSYTDALFKPEYFMGHPTLYTPLHTPQITVTQYSPFAAYTFSNLPPHLGGRTAQTFSGKNLD